MRWRPTWFEKHREFLRYDPRGVAKVIRARRYLLHRAKGDQAEIERKLAFSESTAIRCATTP